MGGGATALIRLMKRRLKIKSLISSGDGVSLGSLLCHFVCDTCLYISCVTGIQYVYKELLSPLAVLALI